MEIKNAEETMTNLQINDKFGSIPKDWSSAIEISERLASSSLVPEAFKNKPQDILMTLQMGAEVGLSPMQSLQNIAVIRGKPTLWGDAMLALVKGHPDFEDIQETIEIEGDDKVAVCRIKRKGQSEVISRFSWKDAQLAGLPGKGVWKTYPRRMLQMRARGFALRDAFPDALKGIITREEANDYPTTANVSSINVTPPSERLGESKPKLTDKLFNQMLERLSNDEVDYFDSKIGAVREKYFFSDEQDEALQEYYNLALDRQNEEK
jgi:hypothetical protein